MSRIDRDRVLDRLTDLVAKSLAFYDADPEPAPGGDPAGAATPPRYRLLETVRAYAADRLGQAGEDAQVRDRHAAFFLRLAEDAEPRLKGPDQARWLRRLETEHDNLRAALRRLEETDPARALRAAVALSRWWQVRGHLGEGRERFEQALLRADPGPPALRADALDRAARLAWYQGDFSRGRSLLEESLALHRRLDNPAGAVRAMADLAHVLAILGEPDRARALYDEARRICAGLGDVEARHDLLWSECSTAFYAGDLGPARALAEEGLGLAALLGDARSVATFRNFLGLVHLLRHDLTPAARAPLETSLRAAEALGDPWLVSSNLWGLGLTALAEGDLVSARVLLTRAMAAMLPTGSQWVVFGIEGFALLAAAEGDPGRAARLLGFAEAFRAANGFPLSPVFRDFFAPHGGAVRAALGAEIAARLANEGRAMSREAAITQALAPPSTERFSDENGGGGTRSTRG